MKRAILEARLESESKHATSTKAYKWLDDFQLRDVYKGREEQVENIKTNAKSCWCKVRCVMLWWASPYYAISEVASNDSTGKRELSTSEASTPRKKKKRYLRETPPKKLTLDQLHGLRNHKHNLMELLVKVKLTNRKANLTELVEEFRNIDRAPLKQIELMITSMIAKVENCIDSEMANFADLRKEITIAAEAAKFHHKELEIRIADVENQLAPEVKAIIQEKMDAAEWPLLE